MALINCTECSKEISDKATACPGCGCPVEMIIPPPPPIQIDCTKYDCNELWHKAYDIQYKGKKSDLPTAIEMYKYIVYNYSDSPDAGYARKQLEIIGVEVKFTEPVQPPVQQETVKDTRTQVITNVRDNIELTQCPNCYKNIVVGTNECFECNHVLTDKEIKDGKKSSFVYAARSSSSPSYAASINVRMPEVPTGLYVATAILGFPLGTGIAIGFNIGANNRINKGDYAKAEKYINGTKIACWVIVVPCAIAVLMLMAMCSSMR